MSFNPFVSVKDYPGMLNKIATFTFLVALLALWSLRSEYRGLDILLSPLTIPIPITSGLNIPLGTVLPAFVYALLSRIFKIHDRISDVLFIRHRFDISAILLPLAIASGVSLNTDQIRSINKQREPLMYKVFYKYTSSSPGKAQIESHYIVMALDQWCWYWIVLEAAFLSFLLAAVFLLTGRYFLSSLLFAGVLAASGILLLIQKLCVNYALQEVEQIVANPTRRLEIAEVFRAL